jgi:hypothetical protein
MGACSSRLERLGWRAGLALSCALAASRGAFAAERAELSCALASAELLDPPAPAAATNDAAAPSLPFEELAVRRGGTDNRALLELAADEPGFWAGLRSTAHLRLELGLNALAAGEQPALRDASSYLGIAWRASAVLELSLRAFPFDTDYARLGYLRGLDWGGTDVARAESVFVRQRGGAPGLELALTTPRARLFAGLKWASAPEAPSSLESGSDARRLWGVSFGGSAALGSSLRADFGFGYFQRAPLELGTRHLPSFVEGASLRLVWHRGVEEPELAPEPFRPPSLRDEPMRLDAPAPQGLAVALEGVALVERLRRFEAPERTALTTAPGAALYASLRRGALSGHVALAWRSLAFVLRNQPGVATGETLPTRSLEHAELAAWFGAGISWLPAQLTPSVELGLLLPAALEAPSSLPGYVQTFTVRGPGQIQPLPLAARRLPLLAARLALRFQASRSLALSVFGEYERDPNRVRFAAVADAAVRSFASPDSLRAGGSVQARF